LTAGTNQAYTLANGPLPNDRFLFGLRIVFEGRMTNAASGYPTSVLADAPYSLIENLKIEGYHRIRGQREMFYNIRGAELRELNRIYTAHPPFLLPATALSVATNATNDIKFSLDVPFVPENLPIAQQLGYLLDAPNYDALTATIQFSDDKSVFAGQTTASAFTAYGLTTGSPRIRVTGLFAMGGPTKFSGFVPARIWRTYQEVVAGDIVAGNNNARLFNLLKGYQIRSMLLKVGTKSATVTAGNNSYVALNNTNIANIKVMQGINRPIRYYTDQYSLAEESGNCYGLTPTVGYGLIDFCQRGHMWEALQTQGLVAGTSGDTDFFLQGDTTALAAQAALLVTEEIRQYPKRA
jgi:hypothetical protein